MGPGVLAVKLALEQASGGSLGFGLPVAPRLDAHLAGALGGVAWLLARNLRRAHISIQATPGRAT